MCASVVNCVVFIAVASDGCGRDFTKLGTLPARLKLPSGIVNYARSTEYVPRMAFLVDYTMSRSCMGVYLDFILYSFALASPIDSSLDCSSMQFACRLHSAFPFGSAQVLSYRVVLPTANMDHNRKMHHRLGFGHCLCAGGEVAKR